jgi:hypothetical protein
MPNLSASEDGQILPDVLLVLCDESRSVIPGFDEEIEGPADYTKGSLGAASFSTDALASTAFT